MKCGLNGGPRTRRRILVCLDALEPVSDCDPQTPIKAGWCVKAGELMDHARAKAWMVVHVLPDRPPPGRGGWRAISGLAPAPSEPVFHRDPPSAFHNVAFTRLAVRNVGSELVLVGASVRASCLATALEGARFGTNIVIASDAMALPLTEWQGIIALSQLGRRQDRGAVYTATTRWLLDRPTGLRVIRGGRS